MKKSKFTESQIAFVLRQAEEGTGIGEVCRKAGINEATFYNWRHHRPCSLPKKREFSSPSGPRLGASSTAGRTLASAGGIRGGHSSGKMTWRLIYSRRLR